MIRRLLPALLVALATSPALADPWPICDRGQPRAACVVDGDTVWAGGVKIRLAATDAPEVGQPAHGGHAACAAEHAAGIRARDRLAALLAPGPRIVPTGALDRYGRTLARLVVPAGDVETILLAEGLTLPYRPGRAAHATRTEHWCGKDR